VEQEAYLAIKKEAEAQPNEKAALAYLLYEAEKIPEDKEGRLALGFLYNETLFGYEELTFDAANPIFRALGEEAAFEKSLAQLNECLRKEDYGSAEVVLSLILPFAESFAGYIGKDPTHRYVYFESLMDQFLFAYHNPQDEVRVREIPFNIAQVFYVKGYLLDEEKRYEEARPYLKEALRYFPTKMVYRLEALEAETHGGEKEKIQAMILEDFGYLHEANDAAILYGQLALLALADKRYEDAYVLTMLGMTFAEKEDEKKAMDDLALAITGLLQNKAEEMTPEKLIAFLDERQLPLGADPSFLDYLQKGIRHLSESLREYDAAIALAEAFLSLSGHSPESEALLKGLLKKKGEAEA
jgi:tetratricopeptide (TPR) repeat protein